jgi:hypothetical protein
MNQFVTWFITLFKRFDSGDLPNYPDPAEPDDLGTDLTQDDKDFLKRLRKEVQGRFPETLP